MDNRYNHKNRRKYNLKVHIVIVTKYMKKILKDSIAKDVKQYIEDIATEKGYEILAMETDKDHIHFLIGYDCTDCVANIVKTVKQRQPIYYGRNIVDICLNVTGRKRYSGQMVILLVA